MNDFIPDDKFVPDSSGPAPASVVPQTGGASADFIPDDQFVSDEDKYGSPGQQALAGVEGVTKGLAGPLAPALERAVGADPQDIRLRAENNPWTHGIGEGVGFVGGALAGTGEAALVAKVGEGVLGAAKLGEATSVGARLAAGATRLGAEMATIQAADEASKAILEDPHQTIGSAISNIGLSAALGAVGGSAFSGAGMLARGTLEKSGLGNVLTDFKDRLKYRASNVNPAEMAMKEVEDNVNSYRNVGSDIGGFSGLKGEAIEKVLPEAVTPEIKASVQEVADKAHAAFVDMAKEGVPERLMQKFQSRFQQYLERVTDPNASVMEHFDAVNDFKKDISDFSKGNYGPFSVKPHDEAHDFLKITKSLGHDVRLSMEDPGVWGTDAAHLQKNLNSTWSEAKKFVDQTESKLMSRVGEDLVADPAKFTTYFNQAGKAASPTIRQQIMDGFVSKMDAFHDAVANAYEKAGVEIPERPSLNALRDSVDKPSVGSRLADTWYDKLAGKALAEAGGAGIGGTVGHATGIPGAGFAGTYLGGKLGETILPSMIQPLLEKGANSRAFQEALAFGQSVMKGDKLLSSSAKAVFQGGETIPKHLIPTDETLTKLDDKVKDLGVDQQKMFNVGGNLGHYMPNHAAALSETAMNAVNTINKFRPQVPKRSPLDADAKPSPMQRQAFQRALSVAQQPLVVMKHIKNGTLLPQDVEALKTLYPKYYEKVSRQLVDEMTNHLADKKTVPYKVRQSMSLFLGMPLDSNFTPENIMAAQAVFMKQKMGSPPPGSPAAGKPKGSTKGMSDIANQYRTRDQSAILRQSK